MSFLKRVLIRSILKIHFYEYFFPGPKDRAKYFVENVAEDNMKNTTDILIFHYAANNAAEKSGGNSAEKAAIYRKIFADLYHTQYFAIIEAYKKAADKRDLLGRIIESYKKAAEKPKNL